MTPYHYTHNNPINRIDPDGNNDFEIKLAVKHPYSAIKVYSNAQKASSYAEKNATRLGGGLRNGRADAARHTYWNALNARDLGGQIAKKFGDAHEKGPNNPGEKMMDLKNNSVGRVIGESNPDATDEQLQGLVDDALNNGELQETPDPNLNETMGNDSYDYADPDDDYNYDGQETDYNYKKYDEKDNYKKN